MYVYVSSSHDQVEHDVVHLDVTEVFQRSLCLDVNDMLYDGHQLLYQSRVILHHQSTPLRKYLYITRVHVVM